MYNNGTLPNEVTSQIKQAQITLTVLHLGSCSKKSPFLGISIVK